MSVKFQDSNDQGTRVGLLLPVGEKVYYTFPDESMLLKLVLYFMIITCG